jgi:hypothetical protein
MSTFAPVTTGVLKTTLSITDTGGASPQDIPLKGTGD